MFWAAAQLVPNRERFALHFLRQAGFVTYAPRVRDRRVQSGKKVDVLLPLFPGYAFVEIQLQWYAARWCPGVVRLIMDGDHPAHVPDRVIGALQDRERNGVIVLPKNGLRIGESVRIRSGPLEGRLAVFNGQSPRERVRVLLELLGRLSQVELPRAAIERAE